MEHVEHNGEFAGFVHRTTPKNHWSYAHSWAPTTLLGVFQSKKAAREALIQHAGYIYAGLKKLFDKEQSK